MIREMAFATKQELSTETLLWRGVIARTIHDWLSKPLLYIPTIAQPWMPFSEEYVCNHMRTDKECRQNGIQDLQLPCEQSGEHQSR